MGMTVSHNFTKTRDDNGVKTVHRENITSQTFGLTLTYTREGDRGNQKIVVTNKGDRYRVVNTYDDQTGKDDKMYSKKELLELLTTCELRNELQFMVEYLQKQD